MEKVKSNVDILYLIFKHLNLEEHIKLTQVCTQFSTVVGDFMWRNKYTNLEVFRTAQNCILTNNYKGNDGKKVTYGSYENVKEEKTVINNKDFHNFLQLIANNIKVLMLSSPKFTSLKHSNNSDKNISIFFSPREYGVKFDNTTKFSSLTSIIYKNIIVTEKDVKLLVINCQNLEKFSLHNCLNTHESTLVIGQDIKLATIQDMWALKSFQIKATYNLDDDFYYDLNEILTKLHKQELIIKIRNFSITDRYCDNKAPSVNPCEELSIAYFRSRRIFNKFYTNILNNFINLKKLTLESYYGISINEDFFDKLSKTCTQLKYLKLTFFEIDNFLPPNTLNVLILDNCSGLNWKDLKHVLSDTKLKSFSIMDTDYIGIFEYFKVTSTLKYIHINNCQRCHFQRLFEMNDGENLKNLSSIIWYNNFAEVPIYIAINCENLKTLAAEPSSLLINNIYSLKSLEKLVFQVKRKLKFSYILTILKHPSLDQLTILKLKTSDDDYNIGFNDYLLDNDINDLELLKLENMKTNLTFLNISVNSYFKIVQDFWFNLLRNNPKLLLMIRYTRYDRFDDHSFLKYIVCNRKFPKRLKSINISGYNIELQELKDNFEAVIYKIRMFLDQYNAKKHSGYILL